MTRPNGWNGLQNSVAYRRYDDYGDVLSPQHPHFGLDRRRYVEEPRADDDDDDDSQRVQIRPRGVLPPSAFAHLIGPESRVSTLVINILPRTSDPLFSVFSDILEGARCLPYSGAIYAEYLD